jgi:ADA HAT complex component 1
MLRLLSWSSGLAAEKMTPQEINYFAPLRQRSPNMELQKPPPLKRKRIVGAEADATKSCVKPRTKNMENMKNASHQSVPTTPMPSHTSVPILSHFINSTPMHPAPSLPKFEHTKMEKAQAIPDQPRTTSTKPDKEKLRQTLNSQISLEILLRHNELRLIDQEIAKCQIALEQLRRCSEIPYPMTKLSPSVSQGQGPPIRSSRVALQPESPAPWGVNDGPYTRHYAKWLIPDPMFDGGDFPGRTGFNSQVGKTPIKGRSTRGSFADSSPAGNAKAQRAGKFQALSSGYPQPKDRTGPMMQKRKSDGLLVKLVCPDCRRDNFSSAQGFINHCRIAHSRNFASHDAAADACGEPVDVDEAGVVVGSETPSTGSTVGLVHPLIYTAHLPKQESHRKAASPGPSAGTSSLSGTKSWQPCVAKPAEPCPASHLNPSPLTPNLSTMMQRQGANLDLQGFVNAMTAAVPTDDLSQDEDEVDEDISMPECAPLGRHPHVTPSMQPSRSTMTEQAEANSNSWKGLNNLRVPQRPRDHFSVPPIQARTENISASPLVPELAVNDVEVSPTNESNQAPSLVDDDGDDDYEAHSPSYSVSGSVDTENPDLDFEIEDGDESGPSSRNRSSESEYSGTPKHHAAPVPQRRASAFRRSISGREEKHVSFVSPSPARETEPSKKGGERKRKRTGAGP